MFGLLGIGSLKVVLISTGLASKDWGGYNICQSYKENFTNEANLVAGGQRGERTQLVPD